MWCYKQFSIAEKKEELGRIVNKIEDEIKKNQDKIQELESKLSSLFEQEKLAEKLQLTDGKCPVCDTEVKQLKPIFQEEHIKAEKQKIEKELTNLKIWKMRLNLPT